MKRPVRVLISKIGLDGHDRGAKLIVRNLRDAGMEVIYTGLWQTPASTAQAAMQEDVDVLGVSLLSAAHMTVIPEVVRACGEAGAGDLPVIVGGIIPEQDKQKLHAAGCAGVYNPGTSMAAIIADLERLAEDYRTRRQANRDAPDLETTAGVARAVTLLVDGQASRIGPRPHPQARPRRIGITGAPGVGKSTFIGRFAQSLRAAGRRVAVIAVDPSSPLTGGALLGDRLRMMRGEPDDGLFVRSLASGDAAGGVAPHTDEIAELLGHCGYDPVLIETVGAGQSDVAIRRSADEVLLLLMPGSGDAVQFEKAGIFEIATGFVLNKCDLAGADKTLRELRETLEDDRPIWRVSAMRNEGLEPVRDWAMAIGRPRGD